VAKFHITNETLYRIKEALSLDMQTMLDIYDLESYPMKRERLSGLLKRRGDKAFQVCSYEELGVFLDGLITYKRGPSPKRPDDDASVALTNNLILKKLRIALELKEFEIDIVFQLADTPLSKQEIKSLFRNEAHKNFKYCSDELLIAFLKGLDEFYYDGEEI